jgi:hypothetical protein
MLKYLKQFPYNNMKFNQNIGNSADIYTEKQTNIWLYVLHLTTHSDVKVMTNRMNSD